jgi:phage-related protein (TIGR01555 family)
MATKGRSKKAIAKKAPARDAASKGKTEPQKKIVVDAMAVFREEAKVSRAALTLDGFDNFISRLGLNNDNTLSAGTYEFNLVTRNRIKLEAAYRGSWVVGAVVDSVAEDMTRAGIDVSTNEADEDIKDLQNAISRLQVWQSICLLSKWGRLYGGAIGVLQIEGQKLDTPLNLDTVGQDQFRGLVIFDRWQLNPILNDVIDSGPEMGLPKYYDIVNNPVSVEPNSPTATGQIRVHHSRCIRYTGIDLPFFQAITEMMWGESILERLWDRLISFDNATMSSASLIDRANLRTVGIEGLREIIAAGGEAQAGLVAMFEMMRSMQVNEGLTLIDKNDTFTSTAYSFAGLSDMMLQFGQQLAGASGIPLVRLFGQSPAGLSATGESDLRMYYDNINAQQEAKLRNGWEILLKVLWRSTFGKPAPKDLEFSFTPLWQMSATDKANNAKTQAETVIGAFEAGLTDRASSLKELRQSSGDTGIFSNISDEQIAEAELDEPPMPEDPAQDPNAEKPAPLPGEADPEKEPVKNLDAKPISAIGKMKRWLSK